jgi:hypothetical protein
MESAVQKVGTNLFMKAVQINNYGHISFRMGKTKIRDYLINNQTKIKTKIKIL